MVRKVARTDAVVLIRGESGTGKNLLAQAIHETSSRAEKPFVKVHCAALAPTLLETELFGHVKGAFTGAHRDKVGRFEMAEGGTLFLDEIGDISPEVQTKLLKVLQERTIERVGSSEPMKVDVRIVAATHQNLEELIQQGRFREDLYYRINVFPVLVPSLKDRREDIPELALHFLQIASERCGKRVIDIDDDAMGILKSYHWPGNIRQLENVIERAVVLVEGLAITAEDIPEDIKTIRFSSRESIQRESPAAMPMITTMVPRGNGPRVKRNKEQEKEKILQALHQAGGNKAQAARDLGMARSTLVSKLKKMGLL